MIDYKRVWKVRRMQLIIITAIFAIIGVATAISDKNLLEGLIIWFFGTWIVGALVAAFSKTGGRASSIGFDFISGWFSGSMAAASGGSSFWIFIFMIKMIKVMFGVIAFGVVVELRMQL